MVRVSFERLDPPRTLGHMTLLAKLGEGGMAGVYVASVGGGDLSRLAAVKLLRPGMPDHDYRQRFLDEAKLVVRLHHNNLIGVHEAGEIEDQLFVVMELIEGRDLADVWDRCAELGRAFPVPIAVHIVRSVLRGLHYAHTFPGLQLVHRDVSPSNILIDWPGAVRLADFGLATSVLKTSLTVPGVVFGKVGYMSPEQATRQRLDSRADVYGCGVVLWELLTGRALRDSAFDTQTVAEFEARPPSLLSARVDPELDAIVMRALARDREERYRTASDFLADLGQWIGRHAPGTSQESLAEFMQEIFGGELERDREEYRRLRAEMPGRKRTALLGSSTDVAREGETRSAAGSLQVGEPLQAAGSLQAGASLQAGGSLQAAGPQQDEEFIPAGMVIAERYRVLGRLGRGGMGTVYMGEHVTVGRSVAIKVLTHQWSHNEAVAQRFRAEARAASAAGHPNIIEVFDAGVLDDGRLYLVMEFLTGPNLYEEVQRHGPFEVARACRTIRDVARAVRAAHVVGIIHRDLKPENVMLADRGEEELVKVLDFGISAGAPNSPGTGRLTVPGHALGTPQYMAPEQAKGYAATELFDIYAMGVLLYEVLTGVPPFDSDNLVDVLARKTMETAPSVADRRTDLPDKLVQLVDDCLEIPPERRPQSAEVLIDRIEEILRSLPREAPTVPEAVAANGPDPAVAARTETLSSASGSGPAHPSPVQQARRRRHGGVVAGGVAVLAVAAIVFGISSISSTSSVDDPAGVEAGDRPTSPAFASPAKEPLAGDAAGGPGEAASKAVPAEARDPAPAERAPDAAPTKVRKGGAGEPADAKKESASAADDTTKPWATPECADVRKAAALARQRSAWATLLRKVKRRECWRKRSEHVRLQVQALAELQRFQDCLDVGKGYNDPKIRRYVRLCEARVGK